MTDDRLKALFAADEPPAFDPAFSAAVIGKLARRRLLVDLAGLSGAAALGGLILWAVWPSLEPLVSHLGEGMAPVAACATLAAAVLLSLEGRVTPRLR